MVAQEFWFLLFRPPSQQHPCSLKPQRSYLWRNTAILLPAMPKAAILAATNTTKDSKKAGLFSPKLSCWYCCFPECMQVYCAYYCIRRDLDDGSNDFINSGRGVDDLIHGRGCHSSNLWSPQGSRNDTRSATNDYWCSNSRCSNPGSPDGRCPRNWRVKGHWCSRHNTLCGQDPWVPVSVVDWVDWGESVVHLNLK